MIKYCLICKQRIKGTRSNRKYCSKRCFGVSIKGKRTSIKTEFKKGKTNIYSWKGDNATKGSIHHWIISKKGKAIECAFCGKTSNEARVEWSNKKHDYKRHLNDYQSLCVSCHRKYDLKNNPQSYKRLGNNQYMTKY